VPRAGEFRRYPNFVYENKRLHLLFVAVALMFGFIALSS
jgi:hypothetical protein